MGKIRPTRRKLGLYINWKVKVTLTDSRFICGILMGIDKHLDLVLHEAEETQLFKVKQEVQKKEIRRMLGFVVVRGTEVLTVETVHHSGRELTDPPNKCKLNTIKSKLLTTSMATSSLPAPAAGRGGGIPMPGAMQNGNPAMGGPPMIGGPPLMGAPPMGAPPMSGGPMMGPPPMGGKNFGGKGYW